MSLNALPPGTILDRNLEVKRVLGDGGFGITYLVHDHDLQQDLVLKEFFPSAWARRVGQNVVPVDEPQARLDFSHFLKRFLDEARIAAKVDHPNLVKVHRFFPANGTGYFAMAWHEGETLDGLLKRQGVMTPVAAMRLLEPLLDGLERFHAAGLIHRDIKPGNIYVRKDGSPLLLDFGSARAPANHSRSGPMTTVLSPGYAPFEQYTIDGIQGPHTDIYAMGAVLYRMLTGEKPLDAMTRRDEASTEARHVPCVNAAPASVPLAFSRVVDQAMAMEISQRIADAPALRRALRDALLEPAVEMMPQSALQTAHPVSGSAGDSGTLVTVPKSSPLPLIVAVMVVAGLVAIVPFWLPIRQPEVVGQPAGGSTPTPHPTAASQAQIAPPAPDRVVVSSEPVNSAVASPVPTQDLVEQVRAELPPRDLSVSVTLDPPLSRFVEGEFLSIGFSTKEDAYAAVFIYSQDGSVTMLYPNDYAKGEQVKANQMNWVGAAGQKFRLQVAPPYGTDIIHVVAFRNPDDFRLLLDVFEINKATNEMFLIDRGSFTRSVVSLKTRGVKVVAAPSSGQPVANAAKRGWGDAISSITTMAR